MKMFATHSLTQHNRLVRLVMLVIVVGLTIFLYTSYYANQTIQQLPSSQRYHMPSLISVSSMLDDDSSSSDNSFQYNNAISGSSISINNLNNNNVNSNSNSNRNSIIAGTVGNEHVLTNEVGDSSSSSLNVIVSGQNRLSIDKQKIIGNNINNNIISNSLVNNNDVNSIAQQPSSAGKNITFLTCVLKH